MVKYECVNAKVVVVILSLPAVNLHVIGVYGPFDDQSERENDKFWNRLEGMAAGIGNRWKTMLMGGLDGWLGDKFLLESLGSLG